MHWEEWMDEYKNCSSFDRFPMRFYNINQSTIFFLKQFNRYLSLSLEFYVDDKQSFKWFLEFMHEVGYRQGVHITRVVFEYMIEEDLELFTKLQEIKPQENIHKLLLKSSKDSEEDSKDNEKYKAILKEKRHKFNFKLLMEK
mmetsp:Transcript_8546/g.7569  ORF Transcript_8546/g.7569 Transcript_8546/m.7569 type:complete len:142 (+) Transcript_8546:116-541(+)